MEAADESSFASRLDCNVAHNPGDRAVDISAKLARGMIKEHLTLLADLDKAA
jgi:hypothetical protein